MSGLADRGERVKKFLIWLEAQDEPKKIWECKEFLFDNYTLSEKAMMETIRQLLNYRFIIFKGGGFVRTKKKLLL